MEGDPGIGKTALGHELAKRAGGAGLTASWAVCWEGEGAPAYRPWAQVLAVAGLAGDRLLAPAAESRFAFFSEVVGLLRSAAAERGMLIVLDDLHWADIPSLRLLQVLAGEIVDARILVLGPYQPAGAYPRSDFARALRGAAGAGHRADESRTAIHCGGRTAGSVRRG